MAAASSPLRALALLFLAFAALGTTECYLHDPLDPTLEWHNPYDLLTFRVSTDDYPGLIEAIGNLVIDPNVNNLIFKSVFVLHRQNPSNSKPFKWLMLELLGDGDNKTMLAIRQDNLYVTGFTDRDGNWYIFQNKDRRIIPVARVFRVADDYPSLVGGFRNLRGVRVSKQTTLDAIERIANFVPADSADVGCISRALAILVATFAEGSRFQPINELVAHFWETGADLGPVSNLVVKWRVLSCALMISVQENESWNSDEARDLRGVNIYNIDDALSVLEVAIWPADGRCSKLITWLK